MYRILIIHYIVASLPYVVSTDIIMNIILLTDLKLKTISVNIGLSASTKLNNRLSEKLKIPISVQHYYFYYLSTLLVRHYPLTLVSSMNIVRWHLNFFYSPRISKNNITKGTA